MVKERNIGIDAIRGAAAFMVVFTHIIQLYGSGSNNIVNNMFLALQMPLFMMVSGYTSKFGKPIETSTQLLSQIGKRSRLLLLPWLSWSLLVYITYKSDTPFFEHISNVAYHMEGAYWFLFSLWCIDVVFCLAQFVNNRIFLKGKNIIGILIPFYLCIFVYAMIGYFCGFSFLGLKYTLYYQLFFVLGFLLTKFDLKKMDDSFVEILMMVSAIIFFCITCKTNIFELPDSPYSTGVRIFVSMIGCLVVFYSFNKIKWNPDNRITKFLQWGRLSENIM